MRSIREMLRGNLLIFTLGDVMRQLSMFITFPFFSLYIQALGGNTITIGLVNGLRPIAAFFIYPIAGFIADRYSRVKIIVATGFLSSALFLIYMLAPDWRTLAIGNLLMGLVVFHFPAMNSLMADSLPPGRRGVGYSLWRTFPGVIGILSPYIGGYLITIFGIKRAMRVLYFLTIAMTLGITVMYYKFLSETQKRVGLSTTSPLRVVSDSYREMFKVLKWMPNSLKAFSAMLILSFLINNVAVPFWVVYGIEEIGLSELQWGTALLIAAFVNVALLVPAGMIVDRFAVKKVLALSLALSAVPVFLFPFSRGLLDTALMLVAVTIANTFLFSGAPTFMAISVPKEMRGRVMAALGQGMLFINILGMTGGPGMGAILTVPSVLGALIGGFIYSFDPKLPWMLLATSLLLNAGIAAVFIKTSKREIGKNLQEDYI